MKPGGIIIGAASAIGVLIAARFIVGDGLVYIEGPNNPPSQSKGIVLNADTILSAAAVGAAAGAIAGKFALIAGAAAGGVAAYVVYTLTDM